MAVTIHTQYDHEIGHSFICKVEHTPPFEKRHGIVIERVSDFSFRDRPEEIEDIMTRIEFVNTGDRDTSMQGYIYVKKKWYWLYKLRNRFHNKSWPLLWWLYKHARMFQPVQPCECIQMSRQFTPIYVTRKLWKWLDWQTDPEHPTNYPLFHSNPDGGSSCTVSRIPLNWSIGKDKNLYIVTPTS